MRVLIIEANSDIRYLVGKFIRRDLNIEAHAVQNVAEAAEILRSAAFDVVVIGSHLFVPIAKVAQAVQAITPEAAIIFFSPSMEVDNSKLRGLSVAGVVAPPQFRVLTQTIGDQARLNRRQGRFL